MIFFLAKQLRTHERKIIASKKDKIEKKIKNGKKITEQTIPTYNKTHTKKIKKKN